MDLDKLLEEINQPRAHTLVVHMVSGKTLELPPGVVAWLDGVDTLLIIWPATDGHDFRAKQSRWLSGVNVESVETLSAA